MDNTLLNIAGKIESPTVSVYKAVSDAATALDTPIIVVGASARDLVMHHGYGAPIERATQDVDFGVQVQSWNAFYALRAELIKLGFTPAKVEHRLYSDKNIPIDIVPFGGNQQDGTQVSWPPDGGFVMNAMGFQEACENALQVRIHENPDLDIPVATPEGMMLLKLIAWTDRPRDERTKDATDILYLLQNHEELPSVRDGLYEFPSCMDTYDWDITLAASHDLGVKTRRIAFNATAEMINNFVDGQNERLPLELLIEEMSGTNARQYERTAEVMSAFVNGFQTRRHD